MKYIVVQTPPEETVVASYLKREVGAIIGKYKTLWKIYCPESRTKTYFGGIGRFKCFCSGTLPFLRSGSKMKHKFYKANAEIVQP